MVGIWTIETHFRNGVIMLKINRLLKFIEVYGSPMFWDAWTSWKTILAIYCNFLTLLGNPQKRGLV